MSSRTCSDKKKTWDSSKITETLAYESHRVTLGQIWHGIFSENELVTGRLIEPEAMKSIGTWS